jgi:hypothetical protein
MSTARSSSQFHICQCIGIRCGIVNIFKARIRVLAARCARGLTEFCASRREGAGKAGCALHPRSRVQKCAKNAHEHTGSAEASGLPCAMVLRLMPRSPRRRIRFCHRHRRIKACRTRLGLENLRRLDISNGCRDHAVLPYASAPFVCAPFDRSRVWLNPKPALQFTCAPDAAASTASHRTFVTIAIRPSCRVRRADS